MAATTTRTLGPLLEPAITVADVEDRLADFVAAHYERLVRLAYLICRDGADASDAVQGALERAWRRRGALRDEASLRAWLDRIVVREAIRVGTRHRSLVARLFGHERPDPEVEPVDARSEAVLAWADVRDAYSRLSAEQRAVIALHLYLGYSVQETAQLVGAPVETVRSRLRLARERLRRELGPDR
jgi:RNA polymerase sigma-70 factor (ECF subfamily)